MPQIGLVKLIIRSTCAWVSRALVSDPHATQAGLTRLAGSSPLCGLQ